MDATAGLPAIPLLYAYIYTKFLLLALTNTVGEISVEHGIDVGKFIIKANAGYEVWTNIAQNVSQKHAQRALDAYFPPFHKNGQTFRNQHLSYVGQEVDMRYHDDYTDWPDKSYNWTGVKGTADQTMWGTMYTQAQIWKHQFPMTCEGKKILAIRIYSWGMGTVLKHISRILGWGMKRGMIAMYTPESWIWSNGPFCGREKPGMGCYFSPITNCTGNNNNTIKEAIHNGWKGYLQVTADLEFTPENIVPGFVQEMLSHSPMLFTGKRSLYYWEIQGLTFLCRMNEQFVRWVKKMYHDVDVATSGGTDVNTHIRHGDKQSEMALIPTSKYIETMKMICTIRNKTRLSVFISTEDTSAIQEMKATDWLDVHYLLHERINGGFFEFKDKAADVAMVSYANLYFNMRGEFDLTTKRSNWNRLVMALRSTVGYKGNGYTLEVGGLPGNCYTAEHCRLQGFAGNVDLT